MKKEWDTIELLRQVRHDWLNKLQLIKGNLDLNHVERARNIIDEIVIEAQNESKLTNLNLPLFTGILLTHNWNNANFQLEFEIISDVKCGSLDDQELSIWTSMFFECLHHSSKQYAENHLMMTIETKQEGICFFFDFSGIIEKKAKIQQFLQRSASNGITVERFDLTEDEFTLETYAPYKENE